MPKWILFLDDTRDWPRRGEHFDEMWEHIDYNVPEGTAFKNDDIRLCKTVQEAKDLILKEGLPAFMSLDHDMGMGAEGKVAETGMDFLKWLQFVYQEGPIPPYRLHTANTVAYQNMYSFLASWEKSLGVQP